MSVCRNCGDEFDDDKEGVSLFHAADNYCEDFCSTVCLYEYYQGILNR